MKTYDIGPGDSLHVDSRPPHRGRNPGRREARLLLVLYAPEQEPACVERKAQGPAYPRRLVQVLVKDPEPLLYHGEVVYRNGRTVGYIRSASYGFTLGGAVGLAMIDAGEPIDQPYLEGGDWEVDIAGKGTRPSSH